MKKLFLTLFILALFYCVSLSANAAYTFTTFERFPNQMTGGNLYPNRVVRYDNYGRKIGTYYTDRRGNIRSYDRLGRPLGVYRRNHNGGYRVYDQFNRRRGYLR